MATKKDIDALIYSLLKHAQLNDGNELFLPCNEYVPLTETSIKDIMLSYQPQTTPSIEINNIKYTEGSAFSITGTHIVWEADENNGGFNLDNQLSDEILISYHALVPLNQLRIFRKNGMPQETFHRYGDLCFFKQPLSDDFIGWACISNRIDVENLRQLKLSDFHNIERIEKER